ATVLERSGCRFVLTETGGLAGTGRRWSRPVAELLAAGGTGAPDVTVAPEQAAYVYFTSGSTGTPKGALCEHRGMANHLAAKIEDLGLGPDDVVVQNAEQSFDISLWQLAAPLLVGARVLVVPRRDILDVRRFLDVVLGGGTTVLQVVPSYLDVLLRHLERHPDANLGRLRVVSVTGEAVGRPLVARFFARCPGLTLVNAYGATEASDDTTHEVMTATPPEALVPVGHPVRNVTVYVLGPGDALRPLGAPGEIAFSGVCVGRGYVNDPERTAEAFGPDPFRPGERMYRTGDFGRWLPTGSLEFHGRRDEQVKVNGIRIELGEVTARALSHPGVDTAAAVVTPLPGVGKSLVAFYTSPSGVDTGELRAHLAAGLPANAVPARLHRVDALPLTANGKVDRRALVARALDAAAPSTVEAPATPTERRLAEAWAHALDRPVEAIGRADDFFALGGGSLSALRMVAGLGGLVTLADLLRAPVLRELAAVADGSGR
ncbi:MAG TPA: AMP-binding protein, partial [Mycobacteriales bacterium]